MEKAPKLPTNLVSAIRYFGDADRCFEFVKSLRWPNGEVACPRCGVLDPTFISTRRIWKCKGCKKQFSIKVGTIFEDSGLGFDKWLPAIWLISNSKNGISSHELHRALEVTQKTAWFMLHRIRAAMASGTFQKLSGTVESDETYVGGLAKNMHKNVRARKITGTGGTDKVAIHGAIERGGKVVATKIESADKATLHASVTSWVAPGSTVYTDQWQGYNGLPFTHESVNHGLGEYVRGEVHTNSIENFWTLYKRAWKGTYTHNAVKHTDQYLTERVFAFNLRKGSDFDRFSTVVAQTSGIRVTYSALKAGL
jgi:transposase-like protein